MNGMQRIALVTALLGSLVLTGVSATLAAGGIDLGKPMNIVSTLAFFPLDGFVHSRVDVSSAGKPELLFIEAENQTRSDAELWPVIKAAEQFGQLTGVRPLDLRCAKMSFRGTVSQVCGLPTFDLSHAHYRSPYLAFASKTAYVFPLGHGKARIGNRLSGITARIFEQYGCHTTQARCLSSKHALSLPIVAVGRYIETTAQFALESDFGRVIVGPTPQPATHAVPVSQVQYLSYRDVQGALISGTDPPGFGPLVENINAEANIITALVCSADGSRPRSVCGRQAVRTILHHVR